MENHLTIPLKTFDRILHPFTIKHLSKLEVEKDFLIPIESILENLLSSLLMLKD